MRVLVVDNEPEVRTLICDALEDAGYDCVVAKDEDEAGLRLAGERMSLLITDLDLGVGATGYEVARHARAADDELPVLYVTGTAGPRLEHLAVEGSKALLKPFDVDDLVSLAKSLMRRDH